MSNSKLRPYPFFFHFLPPLMHFYFFTSSFCFPKHSTHFLSLHIFLPFTICSIISFSFILSEGQSLIYVVVLFYFNFISLVYFSLSELLFFYLSLFLNVPIFSSLTPFILLSPPLQAFTALLSSMGYAYMQGQTLNHFSPKFFTPFFFFIQNT